MTQTSEKKKKEKQEADAQDASFRLVGQYAKDISFECLKPAFIAKVKKQELSLEVGIEARRMEDDFHELSLKLKGESKDEEGKHLYIVEVDYAGIFEAKNVPQEKLMPFMAIDGATLLFPFVREIIMKSVMDGGYQPNMIEPINFHAMFMQAQHQAQEAEKNAPAEKAQA